MRFSGSGRGHPPTWQETSFGDGEIAFTKKRPDTNVPDDEVFRSSSCRRNDAFPQSGLRLRKCYRDAFSVEHVVKIVQSVVKALEHDCLVRRTINWEGLCDPISMAALLKN